MLKSKDKHLCNVLSNSIFFQVGCIQISLQNHVFKPGIVPCFLKPLLAHFQWDCSRNCPWMSAVLFFPPCLCLFAHSVCALFVCSSVLQKGTGGFLHRLLVSNRAQHTLRLPGENTYSGETARTHVHSPDTNREVIHLSWTACSPLLSKNVKAEGFETIE